MKYDLMTYLQPYWVGEKVNHESVLVLENVQGEVEDIPLLYKAEEILAVYSSDLQQLFEPGRDYELVEGKLRIPATSCVPKMRYADYYPSQRTQTSKVLNEQYGSGYIFFSEGPLMHTMQIAVTYRHSGSWEGEQPPCKAALLPKTTAKINGGGKLDICVFGDSICVGGNSSGFVKTAPMAPIWSVMVCQMLEKQFPQLEVGFRNPSLGGQTSQWGAENAKSAVGYGPGLCIIGFGMNDGTKRISPEEYAQNIRTIMATAQQGNPDCEFVLIAPTIPNGQVGRFLGFQEAYLPVLQALEGPGVAVADMTTFHKALLNKKRFYDMSGNNVNHPNDFLARAYAQVVWQTLAGYGVINRNMGNEKARCK